MTDNRDNVTTKIIKDHLVGGEFSPGKEIALRVDQTLLQDATGTMASLQFEELGLERVAVPLAVQYVDHNMIQLDFKNPDDHRIAAFAARDVIIFSPGNAFPFIPRRSANRPVLNGRHPHDHSGRLHDPRWGRGSDVAVAWPGSLSSSRRPW